MTRSRKIRHNECEELRGEVRAHMRKMAGTTHADTINAVKRKFDAMLSLEVQVGKIDHVRMFLSEGIDPENFSYHALKLAALHRHKDIFDALIQHIFQPERWKDKTAADVMAKAGEILTVVKSVRILDLKERAAFLQAAAESVQSHGAFVFHEARRKQIRPLRAQSPVSAKPL